MPSLLLIFFLSGTFWKSLPGGLYYHCFLFPVPILCCHSAYIILTAVLWIVHKFAFALVKPLDVVCPIRSLTPVMSCGRARCDYNLIKTNTLYFQVWTRPKFTSPSDLNLPLSFLNPDCSHADLQPWTLEQLCVHREIYFDSYSPFHQTLPVEAIFSAAQTTQETDFSSKPL